MDEDRARELLARERERIERSLSELEPGPDDELSHVDQHLADAGSDLFETEREAGLANQLREELAAIERAEQRLSEGKFGLSVESGEPIPDERLERMPWAERTVEEQARYDQRR
jgi:DnaK suppressor protein